MSKYNIALIILIFGAINWGLVGLVQNDIIGTIFGQLSGITRLLYIVIGAAGAYVGIKTFVFKDEDKQ